jgi:hypothetical protein
MVAESSAQDDYHCHPDQLYRDPWSAEVIPATVAIPIHVTRWQAEAVAKEPNRYEKTHVKNFCVCNKRR